MKNDVQVFNNPKFGEVRTLKDDNDVLFCGSDVARMLGYAKPNNAIADHCRCALKRGIPHPQSDNKQIEMTFIPEGDVWRLIVHSKLPKAQEVEHWIMDEVLPSIRRTGEYKVDVLGKKIFCDQYRYNGKTVYVALELGEKVGLGRGTVNSVLRHGKAFIEGVDYFNLRGTQMSAFKIENRGAYRNVKSLTILSEDGYTKLANYYGMETEKDINDVCILPEAPAALPIPQDEQSVLVCGVVERMGQLSSEQLKAMYMLLGCLQK